MAFFFVVAKGPWFLLCLSSLSEKQFPNVSVLYYCTSAEIAEHSHHRLVAFIKKIINLSGDRQNKVLASLINAEIFQAFTVCPKHKESSALCVGVNLKEIFVLSSEKAIGPRLPIPACIAMHLCMNTLLV